MPNRVHLIAVPPTAESLAVALRRAYWRYAEDFNGRKLRWAHLWQNRFYWCAMEERHLWTAIRNVERNPVRPGLVQRREEYKWSSAAGHRENDPRRVLLLEFWRAAGGAERWRQLLEEGESEEELRALRRATYWGKPFGAKEFLAQLEERRRTRTAEPAEAEEPSSGGIEGAGGSYLVAV